jgi:Cys-tRNA(Pro)/Cys-tRNA(Cys) deacylase
MHKTMAMRRLEQAGLGYEAREYPATLRDASRVAAAIGVPSARMFKTLVVERTRGRPLLALVPADRSLDLRALASIVNEKKLTLASHHDAERLTGLQVGGISPLAVRHGAFDVVVDISALVGTRDVEGKGPTDDGHDPIWLSGGRRGKSVGMQAADLVALLEAEVALIAA